MDSDICCSVGKCIRSSGAHAHAGASAFVATGGGVIKTTQTGQDNKSGTSLSASSKAHAAAQAKSDSALAGTINVITEAEICTDSSGKGHCYGDTWYEKEGGCKICICHDADDVRYVCHLHC